MGKKTVGRHVTKPVFRESDFAGRPAEEQAQLSGSLNQLSDQMLSTRQALESIENSGTPLPDVAQPSATDSTPPNPEDPASDATPKPS